MAKRPFCPIMTIGFNPPEKGKTDLRLCMRDCAWYNSVEEKCNVDVIAGYLEAIEAYANSLNDYVEEEHEYSNAAFEKSSYDSDRYSSYL